MIWNGRISEAFFMQESAYECVLGFTKTILTRKVFVTSWLSSVFPAFFFLGRFFGCGGVISTSFCPIQDMQDLSSRKDIPSRAANESMRSWPTLAIVQGMSHAQVSLKNVLRVQPTCDVYLGMDDCRGQRAV